MMKQLLVKNLTVKYLYGSEAISKLSFESKIGEVTSVLAITDGGKTTLLKTLAGLVKVAEGEIILSGNDITNAKSKNRNICLIYNEWGLFDKKTVQENLLFPLKVRKVDKTQALQTAIAIMEKLNLTSIADKKINILTNKEKISVLFARAFMRETDLYLIDNIFNNIEINERESVFMEFLPLIKELSAKAPLIFATDNNFEAQTLGENIIIINYGVVLQKGSYKSIAEHPLSLFVCKIVYGNSLVMQDAIIMEKGDNIFIEFGEQQVQIDKTKLINSIFIGKTVTIAYINDNKAFGIKIFDKRSEQLIYFD